MARQSFTNATSLADARLLLQSRTHDRLTWENRVSADILELTCVSQCSMYHRVRHRDIGDCATDMVSQPEDRIYAKMRLHAEYHCLSSHQSIVRNKRGATIVLLRSAFQRSKHLGMELLGAALAVEACKHFGAGDQSNPDRVAVRPEAFACVEWVADDGNMVEADLGGAELDEHLQSPV